MVQVLVKVKTFLNECSKKAKQHQKILLWITFVVVAVAIILIVLFRVFDFVMTYPEWQVSQYGINNVTEKAVLVNQYRTTLNQIIATFAQIFGGIAILIGLYFAWGNLTTAREGQITERFTRAVDQLGAIDNIGNPAVEIRLGGIYALERISTESEKDYWPIMEILTAYVRKNSSADIKLENSADITVESIDIQGDGNINNDVPKAITVLFDIQAILTVIGRRQYSFRDGKKNYLKLYRTNLQQIDFSLGNFRSTSFMEANLSWANLYNANLSEANLLGANLSRALFFKTNLSKADLSKADLSEANLIDANLSRANLYNANLSEANLINANLSKADFSKANLSRANLIDANLTDANLWKADFTKANLFNAKLTFADLSEANLFEAELLMANLSRVNLTKANLINANLSKADLSNADLSNADLSNANLSNADLRKAKLGNIDFEGAHLEGAHLEGAKNLTTDQLSRVKTLYNAKLDDDLLIPLKEKYPALFEEPEQ